jgi:hypothetical protein
VVIQPEGGDVLVRHGESGVEILADPAGMRDLARWRLALADEEAPDGTHVHLDPGTEPLTSMPLLDLHHQPKKTVGCPGPSAGTQLDVGR